MASDIRVKICGLTDPADIPAAILAGAAYLGFVFFPKSPRHLPLERAAAMAASVPEGVAKVALTVDADDAMLDALTAAVPLDFLQLHGTESPARDLGARRPRSDQFLRQGRRPDPRRRKTARRHRPPRRQCADLRLVADRRAPLAGAVDAGRRPDARKCRRGDPPDRRAPGRCLLGGGKRAGDQGCGPDQGLHRGGARRLRRGVGHRTRPNRRENPGLTRRG